VSHDFEVGANVSCKESTINPHTGLIVKIILPHAFEFFFHIPKNPLTALEIIVLTVLTLLFLHFCTLYFMLL